MALGNKNVRRKKKRKATLATIQTKAGAKAGRNPLIGHDERLETFIRRSLELKRLDYTHVQIAQKIADEFKLVSIPAITTVSTWLLTAYKQTDEEIKNLQWQMRMEQFKELEHLKSKWLQIALTDEIQIQRWKMEEGALQPFMDEDATAEQLEATKTIVKIMERQARLLGLDLAKAIDDKKGDGPQSLQDLQIWMINQINYGTAHGAPLDDAKPVLELKSGLEDQI